MRRLICWLAGIYGLECREKATRRQVPIRPTERQLSSACLSYDHSFGLMSKDERQELMLQAKWWFNAFENDGLVKTVDAVEKESKN